MTSPLPKTNPIASQGYLLVNKPKGKTAFSLVAVLRRRLGIQKIGHAGTLDPLATGVMVMLLGKEYTKLSDKFLTEDKEYLAQVQLGIETDTYDSEGQPMGGTAHCPTLEEVQEVLEQFQGDIMQIPPMFSAKKVNGQKLCNLARKGKTVDRLPVKVKVDIDLLNYQYPYIDLRINCSKGTYIRSLAHDMGKLLTCGAHLSALVRTRSGHFHLRDCMDGELLFSGPADIGLESHISKLHFL